MQREDRLAAITLFAIGAWSVYEAYWQIGFGSIQSPGPGFFPFWLAALLCAISAFYFVVANGCAGQALWNNQSWRRPALAGAVMLAYSLLFDSIGFCLATTLLFFAWLRLIENENLKKSVCVSLIGAFGAYALFVLLLDVGLPSGSLWQ